MYKYAYICPSRYIRSSLLTDDTYLKQDKTHYKFTQDTFVAHFPVITGNVNSILSPAPRDRSVNTPKAKSDTNALQRLRDNWCDCGFQVNDRG